MNFTKMQGLGNDYLYVYGEVPKNVKTLCEKLSDRHFGAGSDGMIFITPSREADYKMRIFNADGSEAEMCGNGIRCVGKYVYDKGYTDKTRLLIDTLAGIKTLNLEVVGGKVKYASVGMGKAECKNELFLDIEGEVITGTPVSIGNPHFVVFVEDAESIALNQIGPKIERNSAFPEGVNVEFVQVLSETSLRMRVWERGSGITLACGTGASATVAAAVSKGFCKANDSIDVRLDGGTLQIVVSEKGEVTMTGPAETVYEGECEL